MAKSHTLSVQTPEGKHQRQVNGTVRVILRAGGNLESFPLGELERLYFERGYDGGGKFCVISRGGRGAWRHVNATARIEVDEDTFLVGELGSFDLCVIPPKAAEPLPPPSRYWEVTYLPDEHGVDRPPEIVEVAGGQVKGTVYDTTPADGLDWSSGRVWGASLDAVATMRRIGPEELATSKSTTNNNGKKV